MTTSTTPRPALRRALDCVSAHARDALKRVRPARAGFTPFQILLGVGAFAALTTGVLITYQNTVSASDELVLDRAMPQIFTGVRDTFPNARTLPDGDLIPTMTAQGKTPGEVISAAADGTPTMTDPFGNPITVVGAGGAAIVTVVGMDDEDCNNVLANFTDRTASQNGFSAVSAGGDALAQPFSSADVAGACDAGDGLNDVVLTLL